MCDPVWVRGVLTRIEQKESAYFGALGAILLAALVETIALAPESRGMAIVIVLVTVPIAWGVSYAILCLYEALPARSHRATGATRIAIAAPLAAIVFLLLFPLSQFDHAAGNVATAGLVGVAIGAFLAARAFGQAESERSRG